MSPQKTNMVNRLVNTKRNLVGEASGKKILQFFTSFGRSCGAGAAEANILKMTFRVDHVATVTDPALGYRGYTRERGG